MSCNRKVIFRSIIGLLFLSFLTLSSINVSAQDGAALFKSNCASCHKPDKDFTGPALHGWKDRVPGGDWVYEWIHNPGSKMNDPYAKPLIAKWKMVMTPFSNLSKAEIDAILKYVDDYKPAEPAAPTGGAAVADDTSKNTLLYGILTLVIGLVALVLLGVNRNLRKLSDEKEGIKRAPALPFLKNKAYIMTGALLLMLLGGYWTINGAIGLGRQQNYQPTQPIFYSHEVHAGVNQISCLYCHGGAQDSKQAGIPSVNVCMNCHVAINEYAGDLKLKREDGTPVDGTAEIQKLYSYAGWDPVKKEYHPDLNNDGIPDGARPIEWVKIHNLPDHVYFNHSQHVSVGKQDCQTCHGEIQKMPEVKQFAQLSMGWCVNCHRETKVNFYNNDDSTGNKFYSIYEKFHNDLKNKKMDSVTVEHIGGTECQKCHY